MLVAADFAAIPAPGALAEAASHFVAAGDFFHLRFTDWTEGDQDVAILLLSPLQMPLPKISITRLPIPMPLIPTLKAYPPLTLRTLDRTSPDTLSPRKSITVLPRTPPYKRVHFQLLFLYEAVHFGEEGSLVFEENSDLGEGHLGAAVLFKADHFVDFGLVYVTFKRLSETLIAVFVTAVKCKSFDWIVSDRIVLANFTENLFAVTLPALRGLLHHFLLNMLRNGRNLFLKLHCLKHRCLVFFPRILHPIK